MQITIENQTFTVRKEPCLVGTNTEDSWLVICDASGEAVGHAMNERDATAICEQIAWRRKVDGKVDDSVDEQLTKEQFVTCLDCVYYQKIYMSQSTTSGNITKLGYCTVEPCQITTTPNSYSCNRAKRRT